MSRRTLLVLLVVVVLSLPGLWFITVRTLIPIWRWSGSDAWVATPCTVIRAEMRSANRHKRSSVFLDLEYRYVAGGTERSGTAYDFAADPPRGKSPSQVVRPEGATTCYVNPFDPADAVLNRDWNRSYLTGLLGLIWLALPFGLAVIGLRRLETKSVQRNTLQTR